jgi:hypothetical protein
MFPSIPRCWKFVRARWRWGRGHCPRCNRNLYAAFPYYMANDPDCPVCKGETATDLRMWRKHRTLVTAKAPAVPGVKM